MGYIITPGEVYVLLRESEKYGGHPCTRHIGLSNEQLMQRLRNGEGASNGGIQYISTFTLMSEATKAASQAFKNIEGSVLGAFNRDGRASFPSIRVDEAFKVRFALGGGVREFYVNHMTLALFRIPGQTSTSFYVKTFYPRPPNELRVEPLAGNT